MMSDLLFLMYNVWCLMSEVRSRTSDVLRQMLCLMCDIWMMSDVWCQMLDFRRLMSDVCMSEWCLMSVCLLSVVRCLMYDVLCSIPGGKIFYPHAWTKKDWSYLQCILCFQECLREVQSTNNKKWFINNNIIK